MNFLVTGGAVKFAAEGGSAIRGLDILFPRRARAKSCVTSWP
jgi:hypothetical protein